MTEGDLALHVNLVEHAAVEPFVAAVAREYQKRTGLNRHLQP